MLALALLLMASPINRADAELLAKLHRANQEETELGRVAASHGQMPEVRSFGAALVKDHERLDRALMAFVKRYEVILPTLTARPEDTRKADEIRAMMGADFDRAFAPFMVDVHTDAVRMAKAGATATGSPLMRTLLTDEVVPALYHHQQMARTLARHVSVR